MNSFIVLAAVLASVCAGPLSPVSVSQDSLGNYKLQYKLVDSSRTEEANQAGEIVGSYAFEDKEGHHHVVKYTAGRDGFQASGDIIPVAPRLTAEVARATAEHFALYNEEAAKSHHLSDHNDNEELEYAPVVHHHHHVLPVSEEEQQYVVIVNGVPQDTEEVALAKRQLLEAHKEAISRLIQ